MLMEIDLKSFHFKILKSWFTSKQHSLPNELLAKTCCIVPDTNLNKGNSTYLKPMLVYKRFWLKIRIILIFYNLVTDLTICALILTSYFRPPPLCQLLMWRGKLIIMPNDYPSVASWSVTKTIHQTFGFQIYLP